MMCAAKTMLKVALALLISFGVAYAAFPEVRTWLVAMAPTLAFLICPISMLFCMKMMNKSCSSQTGNSPTAAPPLPKKDVETN
ncbi:DUF2933 domain-containing protein [Noviherbaspirillum suwonense]|uniref:DUF2933 domain-containing protein n=1 Tax=Noviherbaspirillum suwonense TaxID=1224511 RepID=A0ABY1QUT0_9BURK|nr:DUF2933 domain-containing protein [Noviherbaspirillum suwonense]SMP81465.1 Protein of unknown function [Noviherbaspirillum suwonense]